MPLDVSQVLGSPQLAAAKVWPRGQAWRNASRVNYSTEAILLAPLVAWMLFGPRPDLDPAQTPRFRRVALLAVTRDELALVRLKGRAPAGVIAQVPLDQVQAFDLQRGRGVFPLTVSFRDGDVWRLEIPRFNRKAAAAMAAVVSRPGQQAGLGATSGYAFPPPPARRHRAGVILAAIIGTVVVAGIAIGAVSLRGHGAAAPSGGAPAAGSAAHAAAAATRLRAGSGRPSMSPTASATPTG